MLRTQQCLQMNFWDRLRHERQELWPIKTCRSTIELHAEMINHELVHWSNERETRNSTVKTMARNSPSKWLPYSNILQFRWRWIICFQRVRRVCFRGFHSQQMLFESGMGQQQDCYCISIRLSVHHTDPLLALLTSNWCWYVWRASIQPTCHMRLNCAIFHAHNSI